jgi:hypothetical protein
MKRLAIAMLAFALLAAGNADAKKKRTYCQKAVRAEKAKVVAKKHGVTVYRRGRVASACSDKKKKALGLYIFDAGYKITQVAAANKRCVAIRFGGQGKLDQILTKDLAGKEIGSSVTIVGYNNPVGLVRSMSVSDNCVLAWGELVTDAAGTSTYRVRAKAFGAASDVTSGIVNEIATVAGPDDIAHVSIKASGRAVTVRWTQGGVPQSKLLPG